MLIVPNTLRVSLYGGISGRSWASVLDFVKNTAIGTGDAADQASNVVSQFQISVLPGLTSNVTLTGANYVDLSSATGESGSVGVDAGHSATGGTNGAATTPQVCFLAQKTAAGRRGQRKGRWYLPGVAEAAVDAAGVLDPAEQASHQSTLDDFVTGVGGTGDEWALAVVHRTSATSGTATSPSTLILEAKVATQRRRLR